MSTSAPPHLSFFGFRERPFGKTPDPAFLYESRRHKEALARLEYAVEEREVALLTGAIGSGKTTISRALLDRLGPDREPILIVNPRLSPSQLLARVAAGLGLEPRRSRNELVEQITTRLWELYEAGREVVLLIDEAQLVPGRATFDEIRLLTNFQLDEHNLITVIFIGQPELDRRLEHPAFEALRQRIGVRYRLEALDDADAAAYIEYRVGIAGAVQSPFAPEAVVEVQRAAGGIPRVINNVATALLEAYGRGSKRVSAADVRSAAADLQLQPAPPAPVIMKSSRKRAARHG